MSLIISALSRSPWRLTIGLAGLTPTTNSADYALTRVDGFNTSILARRLWLVGANTVEIALSDALLTGVDYIVTLPNAAGAPSSIIAYRQALNPSGRTEPVLEDIEAEAYGVDTDWLNGARSSSGDLSDVRGSACLKGDMVALALIKPREVYHRPTAGAGLALDVNGPGTDSSLAEQRARLVAQWKTDDRVASATATSTIDSEGRVTVKGAIVDAIAQTLQNVTVGGGT